MLNNNLLKEQRQLFSSHKLAWGYFLCSLFLRFLK